MGVRLKKLSTADKNRESFIDDLEDLIEEDKEELKEDKRVNSVK